MTAADHTPSPAPAPVLDGPSFGDYWPPSETAPEPVPCAVQFCSALQTQGLFCDRHAYKNPLPVSSDEETQS